MTPLRSTGLAAGALALALALLLAVSAGGDATSPAAPSGYPGVRADDLGGAALSAGGIRVDAPAAAWVMSADLRLADGALAELFDGALTLRRAGRRLVVTTGASRLELPRGGGDHHVEAVIRPAGHGGAVLRASVDGRPAARVRRPSRRTWTAMAAGRGRVSGLALLTGALDDPVARLLHRLLAIDAQTPAGREPIGQGRDGRLRFASGWTTGFFASALWRAYDVTGAPLFRNRALRRTLDNRGQEGSDTHDLGFMYERSSVAAWRRLCVGATPDAACPALLRSGLRAADALARLAATNHAAGLIPTRSRTLCRGCRSLQDADTIIDSLMNLPLLFWAADFPGRASYRAIAERHADEVARLLVRADGSTWQAVHVRRSDGALLMRHTHQGLSDDTTWSRGQAWAVYGFAEAALATRSPQLLRVAERTAAYVAARTPRDGVPRWDFDAPRGAPRDASAAVITAAGLERLARACGQLAGCGRPAAWTPLAERMLRGALHRVGRAANDVGVFGGQVYSLGGRTRWDDDAELIWGLDYALEAVLSLRDSTA